MFISASGVESELGVAYSGFQQDVTKRFHRLSTEMATKHGIKEPVCLYHKHEIEELLEYTGFEIQRSWLSEFGNVKIVGKRVS